ncbi:precorrin-6A reductase [Desulfotomaculum nigrificans]|uniref:precorrin-6A reductase n=1 Tax=Desulfotomaculum nigrificans TaxID=1565 RepID=UPI0001FADE90|nr:precorrin-6A reductase [Desulfotomaculum nigrificans]
MILVLAGTVEGRQTAALLQEHGFRVTASVVSPYGAELLSRQGVSCVRTGPLDELSLQALLQQGVSLLVDATHPFATAISQLAMQVARRLGVPYLRLERPAAELPPHPLVHPVESLQQGIDRSLALGRVWFSTLGSKHLPTLVVAARRSGVKLVARVLPDLNVIKACLNLGLNPADIVALQGPCSEDLNLALYRQYRAQVVLTKDSGGTGGVPEKVAAAVKAGIPIVVWQRPRLSYPLVLNSPEQVLEYCLYRL